jgi:plasmid stability protein
MASIILRNFDEALKLRLRARAASHNRSMEDEARDILRSVLSAEDLALPPLGSSVHALFAPLGGLDVPVFDRDSMREPPAFEV